MNAEQKRELLSRLIQETIAIMVKLATYNVDQATREQAVEETNWMNRYGRVIAMIKKIDADIINLQEMRFLDECISVPMFLAQVCNEMDYECIVQYRNGSKKAFGQAICYRRSKFLRTKTYELWLNSRGGIHSGPTDAGGQKESLLFGCRLHFLNADGTVNYRQPPLEVFNAHFPMGEAEKTACAREIAAYFSRQQCEHDHDGLSGRIVMTGDFNFFQDRDGEMQRSIITDAGFADSAKGARTANGFEPLGTFVGYGHDAFRAALPYLVRPINGSSLDDPIDNQLDPEKFLPSRLDHIFVNQHFAVNPLDQTTNVYNPRIYPNTMLDKEPAELTSRQTPSDHLPLSVILRCQEDPRWHEDILRAMAEASSGSA